MQLVPNKIEYWMKMRVVLKLIEQNALVLMRFGRKFLDETLYRGMRTRVIRPKVLKPMKK